MNINLIAEAQFQRAQISLARPTTVRMWIMNFCAFMAIVQSSLTDSYSSLLLALSAVFAAVLTEFLILRESGKGKAIKDGSAVASALILVLLLPNNISPFYAAAGAIFAIAVIKHSFGGLGSNWLNPAAGGWLFINFSWPAAFKTALEGSHLSLMSENFSNAGAGFGTLDFSAFYASSAPIADTFRIFLNNTIFSVFTAEIPAGYLEFFVSRSPGIIADRGVFALILGTIIISATQVSRIWIPIVYISVFGIFVRIAGALPFGGIFGNGDVLFALCTGGTLVAAFFLMADPATGAKSNRGILLTAALGGIIAFLFRYFGAEPYGAVFALLFINAILPLIRIAENKNLYEKQGIST